MNSRRALYKFRPTFACLTSALLLRIHTRENREETRSTRANIITNGFFDYYNYFHVTSRAPGSSTNVCSAPRVCAECFKRRYSTVECSYALRELYTALHHLWRSIGFYKPTFTLDELRHAELRLYNHATTTWDSQARLYFYTRGQHWCSIAARQRRKRRTLIDGAFTAWVQYACHSRAACAQLDYEIAKRRRLLSALG